MEDLRVRTQLLISTMPGGGDGDAGELTPTEGTTTPPALGIINLRAGRFARFGPSAA